MNKIGKTKSLREEDVEEVFSKPSQPTYNPELNNYSNNPELKQRKQNSETQETQIHVEQPKKGTEPESKSIALFVIIGIIIVLIILYFLLGSSKTEFAILKNVTWERLLNIERYQQVTKEGYILPAGANVISSTQELTYKEIKKYN